MKYFWEETAFLVPLLSICHQHSMSRFPYPTCMHPFIFISLLNFLKLSPSWKNYSKAKLKLNLPPLIWKSFRIEYGRKKQLKCTINFLAHDEYQGWIVYGLSGSDEAKANYKMDMLAIMILLQWKGKTCTHLTVTTEPFRKEWLRENFTISSFCLASHFPSCSQALCAHRYCTPVREPTRLSCWMMLVRRGSLKNAPKALPWLTPSKRQRGKRFLLGHFSSCVPSGVAWIPKICIYLSPFTILTPYQG